MSISITEGIRLRWGGRASNPVGGAMRSLVGSTPIPFSQFQKTSVRHSGSSARAAKAAAPATPL